MTASAPSLNSLIVFWLSQNGVPNPPANSYVVVADGQTGIQSVASWNTQQLGAEPSTQTLNALAPQVAIQQSAQADYATHIAQGIAITSTGTPALNATYGLDDTTLNQIQALANDCAVGFGFPNGQSTFAYPDQSGTPHTFASADMVNIYKAMRSVVYQTQTTLASRLQGNNTPWPTQSAVIV